MSSEAAALIAPAKAELLSLVGYALLSTVVCELVCWLLISRGEQYERTCEKFLLAKGRLSKKKEEPLPAASKESKKDKKDKKLAMLERDFEFANRDLIALKSRSNMITAIFHLCEPITHLRVTQPRQHCPAQTRARGAAIPGPKIPHYMPNQARSAALPQSLSSS